jgi:hypothetical protein
MASPTSGQQRTATRFGCAESPSATAVPTVGQQDYRRTPMSQSPELIWFSILCTYLLAVGLPCPLADHASCSFRIRESSER